MNWKIALVLILLFLLVMFTVQNYQVVQIQFLFWGFETSRAIVLFVTLMTGIAIGWILSVIKRQ